MFATLGVFVAGFTLDEAEAVVGPGVDALELVSALVEKSLVVAREVPNAEPRFRMIHTVRQYAEDRLAEAGRQDEARRRMAEYFADLAPAAFSGLTSAEHQVWLLRLDPDVDNMRAAVGWARGRGEFSLCLAVLVPMWIYWYTRGYAGEFRPVVEEILQVDPPLEPEDRVLLLQAVASSRALTGEHESCLPILRELGELQDEVGDERGLAMTRAQIAASSPLEWAVESHRLLGEAIPVLSKLGEHWGSAFALGVLGEILLCEGKAAEADKAQAASMAHARAVGSEHLVGLSLNERGLTALALGDVDLARVRFAESFELHRRVQNRDGLAHCLDGLARLAAAEARPELGAEAVGAADAIRDKIRSTAAPPMRSLREPLLAELEETLGTATFDSARAAGRERVPAPLVEEILRQGDG